MKTLELKDKKTTVVEFYDDLKEIPMRKLNSFQSAILQDAGMGSTLMDVDTRFAKIDAFLGAGKINEAINERNNLRFGLFFFFEEINTKSLSLAHLVYSIDGEKVRDNTEDDLVLISKRLEAAGITYGQILELVESLKKKFNDDLVYYFPELIPKDVTMLFYANVVNRALLLIESVLNPSNRGEVALKAVNDWLLEQAAPKNFDGSDNKNILVENEKAFFETCNVLEELNIVAPENLTAFKFYNKIRYLNAKAEKQNAKNNARNLK